MATKESLMVGVGASAGGLEALERFFSGIPDDLNASFVVVQHLSPDHKSLMADLLAKHTTMPVREAVDGQELLPRTVAMVPPHANLVVESGRLRFRERTGGHAPNLPINLLLTSLAEAYGERAAGVVLSGTGSDGRIGLESIKQHGGFLLVQDPTTARFDGMPLAAISTGLVDVVAPPDAMGQDLLSLQQHGTAQREILAWGTDEASIQAIEQRLLGASGIDFAEYKPATVLRRIARRMAALTVPSLAEYARRLELDPNEVQALSRELLINVTQFFRDPEVFAGLERHWLKALVDRAGGEQVRVWVAGCSTGQEVYSLGMLLTEAAPRGGFKIFATDVDNQALEAAALGLFTEADLADVSEARRARFFVRASGEQWEIERELRRRVIFAPHNVARDPPFTRLDLVSCRNLLIYLSAPLQKRVLGTFAFALKPDGLLVLGSSESLGEVSPRFEALDTHLKVFRRLDGPRTFLPSPSATHARLAVAPVSDQQQAIDAATRLLLDRVVPAAVMTNDKLELVRVFGNAERLLSLPSGAVSLALPALLPPPLQTVTTLAAHRALSSGTDTAMAVAADEHNVGLVRVQPFTAGRSSGRFLVVTYERGVPRPERVDAVSDEASSQIADLQRELLFVRESLQATIEELETSNEELQATNEELLAANEELQSTNEELQSVNEELNTVNAEHQAKIRELTQVNADLDNLFDATTVGTVFVDEDLRIRRFTRAVTEQFSLLERDLGRPIEHITHHFRDLKLAEDLRQAQATGASVEREVSTINDRRYLLRISPYLTENKQVRGGVATFVDVTQLRSEQAHRTHLQGVIDSLPAQVAVVSRDGTIQLVNRAWSQSARDVGGGAIEARTGVGTSYLEVCRSVPELRASLEGLLQGNRDSFSHTYPCNGPDQQRWFMMHVGRLSDGSGAVISHVDITAEHLLVGTKGARPASARADGEQTS